MYIIIGIIAFSILIAAHELGHFTAAKLLGVRVYEFAIGMGPKLLKKQGKETLYTLRLLPFGGFCAMDEDAAPEDSRSFTAQKRWRRVVILAAGGIANVIVAVIIITILVTGRDGFVGNEIVGLAEGFPNAGEDGIMAGDEIVSINGERVYYAEDFLFLMEFAKDGRVDLEIKRGNETISYRNFPLEMREYADANGETQLRFGLAFNYIESNLTEGFKYICYTTANYVRLIRFSIAQLFTGEAGVQDLAGPVAIVDAMNDVGRVSETFGEAIRTIAQFTAFIGVNLAIVNLLPIPAMDGGRILFVIITWFIETIVRRRIDPKYEGYIHTAVLFLLMGFMVFILINDVLRIVSG